MKDDSDSKPKLATEKPLKKGRLGAIVDAEKKARRRSSLGGTITLPVPQIPGQSFLISIDDELIPRRGRKASKSSFHVWKWRYGTTWFRT